MLTNLQATMGQICIRRTKEVDWQLLVSGRFLISSCLVDALQGWHRTCTTPSSEGIRVYIQFLLLMLYATSGRDGTDPSGA